MLRIPMQSVLLALALLGSVPAAMAGEPCTLRADVATISVSGGGVQRLVLDTTLPPLSAGSFQVVGSISGTLPGTLFNGVLLPLNLDRYFIRSWNGGGPFQPATGSFDASGSATVEVTIPATASPTLVGTTVHHAFFVIEPLTLLPSCSSNAVSLTFVP